MEDAGKVTIKEIARRAGVSHSTVSRALNNHPSIAPQTAGRIQQLARDLRYVPSATARSLKTNRSRVLGVVVNRIADPFYGEVLDGIQSVVRDYGYSLFLSAFESDSEREVNVIKAMFERRVEALIIGSTFFTQERVDKLGDLPVPTVYIHNRASEILPHSIYHDDMQGMRELTRHLLDFGHRRIAYVGNQRAGRLNEQRREGVMSELRAAGLSLEETYELTGLNGRLESGAACANQLLELTPRPTAVICWNDMLAIGLMQALQAAGVKIPDDVSVAGFDDNPFASLVYPSLTTFHQPKWELGQLAARLALKLSGEKVDEPHTTDIAITMLGKLVVRRSTASAPAVTS